jgi:hypothetical protein
MISWVEVIFADGILRRLSQICVNEMQRADARRNQQNCFDELE